MCAGSAGGSPRSYAGIAMRPGPSIERAMHSYGNAAWYETAFDFVLKHSCAGDRGRWLRWFRKPLQQSHGNASGCGRTRFHDRRPCAPEGGPT